MGERLSDQVIKITGDETHYMKNRGILKTQELQWLLLGLLFVVYHKKNPLYTSNQNTKFLHGAGEAGYGFLENDWMANTLDPLPLFTFLVKTLYLFNSIEITYFIFGAALLIYFYTLGKIAQYLFPGLKKTAPILVYSALFFLVYHPKTGLAGQYLLGTYLQPCVFGVFFLLSIERFLNNHLKTASILLALSAAFHPAYLPTALIVQANYTILSLVKDKQGIKKTIVPLLLFTLISAPFVLRHIILFAPTAEALHAEAMDILTNKRIPHHTNIHLWFNTESFLKMCLMLFSTLLIRKSRLFPIMFTLYLVIALSGIYLYFSPNTTLAFTTPWRHSVLLAPLSISVLIAWAAQSSNLLLEKQKTLLPIVIITTSTLLLFLTIRNINKQVDTFKAYGKGIEMGAIHYASSHGSSEDIYLVPPDNSLFDKFRLESGIPILANRKTHPYKDKEVIEWDERCRLAEAFYTTETAEEKGRTLRQLVKQYNITHYIIPSEMPSAADLPGETVYSDAHYTLRRAEWIGNGE